MENKHKTKILCKYLGGSHLYKLNTELSDLDERGVVLNTDPSYILGLNKYEESRKIDKTEDSVFRELRHFMFLLMQSNTEALETLWCDENVFDFISEEFRDIRRNRQNLIDSKRLFISLRGYANGEIKLATGERSGKLGSKRKLALEKYGFSPKNFTNLFRLMFTGIEYYKSGNYIVDCNGFGHEKFNFLMDVKCFPENHNIETLKKLYLKLDNELSIAYNGRSFVNLFDQSLANNLLLKIYFPSLLENLK